MQKRLLRKEPFPLLSSLLVSLFVHQKQIIQRQTEIEYMFFDIQWIYKRVIKALIYKYFQ